MEEIQNKQQIKGVIHYLVKWVCWPSEYNSYEPASYLTNAPKLVADFERRYKQKRKGNQMTINSKNSDDEDITLG